MSYEGYDNYQCECGKISEGWDVYDEQPDKCECGKKWLFYQTVDCTNVPVFVGEWREVK